MTLSFETLLFLTAIEILANEQIMAFSVYLHFDFFSFFHSYSLLQAFCQNAKKAILYICPYQIKQPGNA
jgi:hypothetical protein